MQEEEDKYYQLPQPHEINQREREDAMGAYLMMFASWGVGLPLPIINLIAAIIYYYVNRKKSRFVHFHTLQSLLSQIPTTLLNAGAVFWTFAILTGTGIGEDGFESAPVFPREYVGYVIMAVVANLIYIIFSLVACSRAYKGRFYYMLFFGRLAYNYVYSSSNRANSAQPIPANLPPR